MIKLLYLLQHECFGLIFGIITSYLLGILYLNNCKFTPSCFAAEQATEASICKICILHKTLLFSIILIVIFCILSLFFEYFNIFNVIECQPNTDNLSTDSNTTANNKTKDLSVVGNFTGALNLNRAAAQEIGNAISNGASNIGLGASIGATASAVAKVATGTPIKKVVTIGAGAFLGGAVHVLASLANRALAESILDNNTQIYYAGGGVTPASPLQSTPSSFYEVSFFNLLSNNPVESLLLFINIINIISLILIILLIIPLLSKHISTKEYEFKFKWIDTLIPQPYSSYLKNIFTQILKVWNYSSSINIWLIIIILLISICASIYFINILI